MQNNVLCFVLFLVWFCHAVGCVTVNISNTNPKVDVEGHLMDVHDGNLIQWQPNGLFYWYGMGYQNCTLEKSIFPPRNCPGIYKAFGSCGFREDHAVNVYTSPDLVHWTFVQNALPISSRPTGIYFRPKVVFNQKTNKYVMWVNYLPPALNPLLAYPKARAMVAVADVPHGPFVVVNDFVKLAETGVGDFTLLVDDDAERTAYIAYDAWGSNHQMRIEQLTPDYLNSLGKNLLVGAVSEISGIEAPIFFKRSGWYYLMFGPICCFCEEGSGSNVWVSRSPLGPWWFVTEINPKSWFFGSRTVKAQESFVFFVKGLNGKEDTFVYAGDRWGSAPDHLKSHDLQHWEPLLFNDTMIPPTPAQLLGVESFTIHV